MSLRRFPGHVAIERLSGIARPSLHFTLFSPNMFFAKASLIFVVVSLAAVFCAQSVEAARGPKITSKVYFDIKHGDKDMGRSAFTSHSSSEFQLIAPTVVLGLFGGVRCVELIRAEHLTE